MEAKTTLMRVNVPPLESKGTFQDFNLPSILSITGFQIALNLKEALKGIPK